MPQETRLVTADELLRMPDNPHHRYELVRGRLLTMSPPGSLHGLLVTLSICRWEYRSCGS
jgi:Uma2 family endonuclease